MKTTHAFVALAAVLAPSVALAHFPFLHWTELKDQPVLQVYFGETPAPDDPKYLDNLVDGKTWMKPADGAVVPIEIKREDDFLLARPEVDGPAVFGYSKNWGKLSRGDEAFELLYYAKSYSDPAAWTIDTSKQLALDIRPSYADGKLTATALWKGKPLPNAEIVVQGGLAHFEGKTNAKGEFQCELSDPGLYAIRVRHVEEPADGQEKLGQRHYTTATIQLESAK